MKYVVCIPARWGSSRYPGKALHMIDGRPMIWWCWRHATESGASRVVVLTDDERIANAVPDAEVNINDYPYRTGSDRCAYPGFRKKLVINLQGDEPFITPETIDRVAYVARDHDLVTAWNIEPREGDIFMTLGEELPFDSRRRGVLHCTRIPIPNAKRKLGIYGWHPDALQEFAEAEQPAIEKAESLEQMRALYLYMDFVAIQAAETRRGINERTDAPTGHIRVNQGADR